MSFTRFPFFPPELRWKIWEEYCPQLGPEPLILHVTLNPNNDEVRPGHRLALQTTATRNVLSLSRDSRDYALKVLTNNITLRKGQGVVRYIAQRDLVLLDTTLDPEEKARELSVTGFSEQVVNLAFNISGHPWNNFKSLHFFTLCISFPRLRYIFLQVWGPSQRASIPWCMSDFVHRTTLGLTPGLEMKYVWPHLPRYEEWAERAISRVEPFHVNESAIQVFLNHTRDTLEGMELNGEVLTERDLQHLRGIRIWPLVAIPATDSERLARELSIVP